MSTSINAEKAAINTNADAAPPGYQSVVNEEYHQAPTAYAPSSGYEPAPSYYPQQQPYTQPAPSGYSQPHTTTNVVVVHQAAVIPVVTRPDGYIANAGHAANVFAVFVTVFAFVFGCWWSVLCSIPAMIFASSASEAGRRGDTASVRSNNRLSYGCTIAAVVSGVVGAAVILGLVFGLIYRPRCYSYYSYYC